MKQSTTALGGALVLVALALAGLGPPAAATPTTPEGSAIPALDSRTIQDIRKLLADRQFDKALAALAQLEKTKPRDPMVATLQGAAYVGKNDLVRARRSFERALGLHPDSAAATLNLAQLDLREKKLDAARERLDRLLARDPQNTDAMLAMVAVADAMGDTEARGRWLELAMKTRPDDVNIRIALTRHYIRQRDYQKAMSTADEGLAAAPENPRLLDLAAGTRTAAGLPRDAMTRYMKVTLITPKDPVAHYKLALAQAEADDMIGARASVAKALALKPDFLDARVFLAALEIRGKRYAEALAIAKDVQKQPSTAAAGYTLEGDVLVARGDFAPAVAAYQAAAKQSSTSNLAIKLSGALRGTGRTADADALVDHWLDEHPADAAVRGHRGMVRVAAGQYKPAIEDYEKLASADPKNFVALNDLAWLYQQTGDERAQAAAERAYRIAPDNANVLDTLGWILVEQGKTGPGMDYLRKALDLAPESPTIQYHYASALARSGDKARARRQLETLLAKEQRFPDREKAQALLQQL